MRKPELPQLSWSAAILGALTEAAFVILLVLTALLVAFVASRGV